MTDHSHGFTTRRAEFQPKSLNEERRTAELVWTTGAEVLRRSWDGAFFETLSLNPAHVRMGRLSSGRAPLLAQHDGSDLNAVIGVVESARLEAGQGVATVRFAKDDPEADRTWNKVRQGILSSVSVGYRIYKTEKVENGSKPHPTIRAVDWEPFEVSIVALPADANAHVRSSTPITQRGSMDPQIPEENKAAQLEQERVVGIRSAVAAAKLANDVAQRLIVEGVDLRAARLQILDEMAARSASHDINNTIVETDGRARAQVNALAMRLAPALVGAAIRQGVPGFKGSDFDPGVLRGLSLLDLARESLERRGVKTRGLSRLEIAGRAFVTRGAYSGTSDFPVLLEGAIHKLLLAAYETAPDTWSRICRRETVSDFRPHNRFRTGSFGVLDEVPENSEFKNKSIPDGEKTSISVATKGNIIGISRQLIINDDMNALADLATKLGRAAKLSIEADFYALLAQNSGLGPTMSDSQPFFHANRANVNASGSSLSVAGIDADRVILSSQKDPSGNDFLDLRPAVLLVPIGLGGEARVLNDAQYDHDGTKLQKPNKVRGLFRDIVDTPRLSGTRRYLFADPAYAPAFVVAFLEGQNEAPVIENEDGWRVDGTELKVRLDYKVQVFDPKGAVTNAGA